MSASKSSEFQLDFLDRLPSLDCGDEPSSLGCGNAGADSAIGASGDYDQSPTRSDRAQASPVLTKTNACNKHALAGQDAIATCPVDTREPPIPPSSGLVPRKRGRPRGSRNKQRQGQLKSENVPGLAVSEAKASTAIAGNGVRFLSDKDVAHRYSLSRSSIWRLVAKGQFPRPYRLTNGTTRWKIADLDAYDDALGGHYRPKIPDNIFAADLAGQPSAKPSLQASDGGGSRIRRRR